MIAQSGFHGDFAAFVNFLHTDPQFYAHSGEELTMRYAKSPSARTRSCRGCSARCRVSRTAFASFRRKRRKAQRRRITRNGSPALGQAGTFWINLTHLDQRPLYELPALTLHESVPGHHLQIGAGAGARRAAVLPAQRQCHRVHRRLGPLRESLGEDMGMYRTPYERFGRLSYEMWRACRLVADTGIHWMGWDIETPRGNALRRTPRLSPHNIQTELERYIATPGQALAYKVGELNFQALRRDATQALGSAF